ncbi:MAG: ribonuclease HII [Candidatus Aenigmarchaeota archaeon]|nr:ribonuclease HII [Candidatus Aenigmarchaeota archaeon]
MKILGIDEAGRGCVVGPLVMCGYLVDEKNVSGLKKIGVRDSKLLSPLQRNKLIPKLEKLASDVVLIKIPAGEIDKMRTITNLNKIEIERMAQIINAFNPHRVIIDALEANENKFRKKIAGLVNNGCEIVAENFADKNYVEVGAASIMAKVTRDKEIDELQKGFADFGSGYPSDERTINFLKDCVKSNRGFPAFVRKSWLTVRWIQEEIQQRKISSF